MIYRPKRQTSDMPDAENKNIVSEKYDLEETNVELPHSTLYEKHKIIYL